MEAGHVSTVATHRHIVQVHLVEPRFNRLTVFDGRYPHGVRPVEGTRDPLKARLVLHGWFTDPTPFFEGGTLLALSAGTCFCTYPYLLFQLLVTDPAYAAGAGLSEASREKGPQRKAAVRCGPSAIGQDLWMRR